MLKLIEGLTIAVSTIEAFNKFNEELYRYCIDNNILYLSKLIYLLMKPSATALIDSLEALANEEEHICSNILPELHKINWLLARLLRNVNSREQLLNVINKIKNNQYGDKYDWQKIEDRLKSNDISLIDKYEYVLNLSESERVFHFHESLRFMQFYSEYNNICKVPNIELDNYYNLLVYLFIVDNRFSHMFHVYNMNCCYDDIRPIMDALNNNCKNIDMEIYVMCVLYVLNNIEEKYILTLYSDYQQVFYNIKAQTNKFNIERVVAIDALSKANRMLPVLPRQSIKVIWQIINNSNLDLYNEINKLYIGELHKIKLETNEEEIIRLSIAIIDEYSDEEIFSNELELIKSYTKNIPEILEYIINIFENVKVFGVRAEKVLSSLYVSIDKNNYILLGRYESYLKNIKESYITKHGNA